MTQLGLRIYIVFKLSRLFPKKKMFFISFIAGSFFPDIDIILVALSSLLISLDQSIFLFHKTITHSIITLSSIYLVLLIAYEIKKDKIILNIANGFSWGVIIHIIFDLIFRVGKIDLFWPLPIGIIKGWNYGNYQNKILGENTGGTREAFNFKKIKSFDVMNPKIELQNKFAELVHWVEKLKDKYKESEMELNNLFGSLMHRAFRGEL